MNKKAFFIALCLTVILALPSCAKYGNESISPAEVKSEDTASGFEVLFDAVQTRESAPVSTRKTYEGKELLKLNKSDLFLCQMQDEDGTHILVRDESTNEMNLISSSDGASWERKAFAAEAEKAFLAQYPGSYEMVSATAIAPDGTYYSVRITQATAPDDIQVISLRPGATGYSKINTSDWFTKDEDELFFAMNLLAPTNDRLVLVCEMSQSKKMTVGEYVEEYKDGDPGYAFADRDPEEAFEPVTRKKNLALLVDTGTMEVVKALDYSDGGQWMFGEGRWFANQTHLFFKDDNQDEFTFKAYSLVNGQEVADLATSTDYNNWYWPGDKMFFASDDSELFWLNDEGVHRVLQGGSLVEGIFDLDLFDQQDCYISDFWKARDGSYLFAYRKSGEANTMIIYQYN